MLTVACEMIDLGGGNTNAVVLNIQGAAGRTDDVLLTCNFS